jgi:hypothetical protein
LRATIAILYLLAIAMDPEQIWREKSDEDLIEACERLSEFTSEGERIIRAELARRVHRPIGRRNQRALL